MFEKFETSKEKFCENKKKEIPNVKLFFEILQFIIPFFSKINLSYIQKQKTSEHMILCGTLKKQKKILYKSKQSETTLTTTYTQKTYLEKRRVLS